MNTYRVDRVSISSKIIPCGMNSILFIGDNLSEARRVFYRAKPGVDTWGKPDSSYGVALSRYDSGKRDYIRLGFVDSLGSSFMECK